MRVAKLMPQLLRDLIDANRGETFGGDRRS